MNMKTWQNRIVKFEVIGFMPDKYVPTFRQASCACLNVGTYLNTHTATKRDHANNRIFSWDRDVKAFRLELQSISTKQINDLFHIVFNRQAIAPYLGLQHQLDCEHRA